MMDLTQLANLGELVGGVAVLVTLMYLVVRKRAHFNYETAVWFHLAWGHYWPRASVIGRT